MNKNTSVKAPVHQQAAQRVQPVGVKPTVGVAGSGKVPNHGKNSKH